MKKGSPGGGYSFTIKNTCNTYATYQVNLEDLISSEKRLSNEYIKISLNESIPKNLTTYPKVTPTITGSDSSFLLTSGSLAPDKEVTYELKIWMKEETPVISEVMNATFQSKISIIGTYTEEEDLQNEILATVTSQNTGFRNDQETFTIEVTSIKYNIIETSEDGVIYTPSTPTKNVSLEKTYFKEGAYSYYFKDEVGNIKKVDFETTKLDQTVPTISIDESSIQDASLLTITLKDLKSGLQGYAITDTKDTPSTWEEIIGEEVVKEQQVSENKEYYIWSKDQAGNKSYVAYSVTKVDTTAPTLTISNTLTDWGVKDNIKLTSTDDIIGISGYSISETEGNYNWLTVEGSPLTYTNSIEVSKNGTYYVSIKDAFNHITTKNIIINKIDQTAPTITSITGNSTAWTNQDVTITINGAEDSLSGLHITAYSFDNGGTWQGENTKTYATNTDNIIVKVRDKLGNTYTHSSINITKIDKVAPTAPIMTNSSKGLWTKENVTVTMTSTDGLSGIDHYEWLEGNTWTNRNVNIENDTGNIVYTVDRDLTIRFRAIDHSGNIGPESTTVVRRDTVGPTATFNINSQTSGSNGWYQALSIKTTVNDGASGIANATYCVTTTSTCTPSSGASLSSNTFTVTLGNNSSPQKVCTTVVDNASNSSNVICSSTYKVDTVNPTAKISVTNGLNSITVRANGSSDTGSGIVTYYYSKDNATWYSSTSNTYTFTGLSYKAYTLYVKVVDVSGRTSSVVSTIGYPQENAVTVVRNLNNNGQVLTDGTVDNNLRYIGKGPNNYVTFNNELWRIIGVMNNVEDGSGAKASRLKLIKSESIGDYSWDNKASGTGSSTSEYGSNDWSDSTLQEVLNNGAYYNRTSGTCPYGQNGATTACDFTSNGLTPEAKTMIENIKWKLGGSSSDTDVTANMFYERERGTVVYSGRPTEWIGKVGLMYQSDYGYATSGGETTNREACLAKELYNWYVAEVSDCKNNDWLYDFYYWQWTLSPYSGSSYSVFGVTMYGGVNDDIAYGTYGVSPAVYLLSETKISSGNGTKLAPYTLTVG